MPEENATPKKARWSLTLVEATMLFALVAFAAFIIRGITVGFDTMDAELEALIAVIIAS